MALMSWQYIAGYIDGEGSLLLSISREKRRRTKFSEIDGYYLIPALCVTSYDAKTLKTIKNFVEAEDIAYCFTDIKKKRSYQTENATRFQIGGYKNLSQFLPKIYPYSIAKKPQYNLFFRILDIVDSRKQTIVPKAGHRWWTRDKFMKVIKLVDEINQLKKGKRGRLWYPYLSKKWKMKI